MTAYDKDISYSFLMEVANCNMLTLSFFLFSFPFLFDKLGRLVITDYLLTSIRVVILTQADFLSSRILQARHYQPSSKAPVIRQGL